MRKLNKKNKTFVIALSTFVILAIILIILFIINQINIMKIKYEIHPISYVYNEGKELIKVDNESYIKKSALNDYYLISNNKKIKLYDYPVIYNEQEENLLLLGTYYEVLTKGEVKKITDSLLIKDFDEYRIFKIDDRRYLITGKNIVSSDNEFSTKNYLLLDLDKIGNAYLFNNEVNMKTFNELRIVNDEFELNVNEEILIIDSEEISLKNIIGSSNKYKKKTKNNEVEPKIIENEIEKYETITDNKEVINARKTTILEVTPKVDSIKVSYIIYDPYQEYNRVYVNYNGNSMDLYNKDSNIDYEEKNITINNLIPNTDYILDFYYNYGNDNNILFNTYHVKTNNIKGTIKVEKVSQDVVQYKVKIEDYKLETAEVVLKVNNNIVDRYLLSENDITKTISSGFKGSLRLNPYHKGDLIELELINCRYQNNDITINTSYKFII